MIKCFFCDTLITNSNKTEEHILLKSCGGKIKSSDLLCKNCNSQFGSSCDSELYKQLKPFIVMLNIKNEGNNNSNVTFNASGMESDAQYRFGTNGFLERPKPVILKEGSIVRIIAPDKDKAAHMLKKVQKEFPENHIDIANILQNTPIQKNYVNEIVKLDIDAFFGSDVLCSFLKTAIEFALHNGFSTEDLKDAIDILKKNDISIFEIASPYIVARQLVSENITNEIHLQADPTSGKMYCYIEYLNFLCAVCVLNNNYSGKAKTISYIHNPLNGMEVSSDPIIIDIKNLGKYTDDSFQKNFRANILLRVERLLQRYQMEQTQIHTKGLTDTAMKKFQEKYPSDEFPFFTEEMLTDLATTIMDEITPYMLHLHSK